jgi:hypothetical protein
MQLSKSKNANVNYLAKVVKLAEFTPHPNADRMKIAHVGGYKVCVGLDEAEGWYIYFPVNCEINPNLLSYCNLYRHSEKNSNTEKAGFFNDNGRVTAIKLRGVPSEGFLLPLETLKSFISETLNLELSDVEENFDFDIVEHNGKSFWICKKYIIVQQLPNSGKGNYRQKNLKKFNKAIDTQFRYHYDTVLAKKDPFAIEPNDRIHLSSKIHGTSHISAYVLCKKKPSLKTWFLSLFGVEPVEYDYLYASRSVIKNNATSGIGYYGCDVWAEADKIIRPHLIKGMTVYAEIVGFLPTGGYIQKNYDYGCEPPTEGVYISEKNFKVRVYRITLTNVDGVVHEFSTQEVQQWCKDNGLTPVTEMYYGLAKDLYPDIPVDENWNTNFWERLANDKNFYMECDSPDCNNKVPHEGIVIKKEDMRSRAWKLKCFAFLNQEQKELDSGESNIEDNA